MLNLVRRDFIVTYSNKITFYILIGMIPLFLFLIDDFNANMAFMYSTLTFIFIATRTPFSYEIKDKPHLFIQSLPVTKTDIVVSKYISIFINFIIGSIFTIIYIFVLNLLGFIDISVLTFGTLVTTLITSIVLLSISIPTEFIFTPKTANFVNMFIYILFLNIFILQDNLILNFINIFSDYRIAIALIVSLTYFLSMAISILLYKNRKFY